MATTQDPASELCMSCGLCCRGMLHSHGALKPAEVERIARLGLTLLDREHPAFALPCPKFDSCCTIYQERPAACRGFRCALLRKLDDQQIDLDDALQIVREARRLADDAMPEGSAEEKAERFREHLRIANNGPGSADKMTDGERLRFMALALYLDRHFVLAEDGNFYSAQPITGGTS